MIAERPSKPCSVLVIEDEEALRDVVCQTLTEEGHDCMTATSIEEGLRCLTARRPHIVLLDLLVGGRDTETWIPHIKRSGSHLALFSANHRTASIAKEHGVSSLPKPFELDALSAMIARMCKLPAHVVPV